MWTTLLLKYDGVGRLFDPAHVPPHLENFPFQTGAALWGRLQARLVNCVAQHFDRLENNRGNEKRLTRAPLFNLGSFLLR